MNAVTKKQFIHFEDKNNNNNSSNNNDTKRESDSSRLNESLVPKVVHQSAKSKVLSNHDGINLSKSINNYNFIPIGNEKIILTKYCQLINTTALLNFRFA